MSVEDSSKCKRTLSVPGISVNVRRIKVCFYSRHVALMALALLRICLPFQPTAKFYGKKDKRQVTILEGEQANLPLRLTGDGVRPCSYSLGCPHSNHILTVMTALDLEIPQHGESGLSLRRTPHKSERPTPRQAEGPVRDHRCTCSDQLDNNLQR